MSGFEVPERNTLSETWMMSFQTWRYQDGQWCKWLAATNLRTNPAFQFTLKDEEDILAKIDNTMTLKENHCSPISVIHYKTPSISKDAQQLPFKETSQSLCHEGWNIYNHKVHRCKARHQLLNLTITNPH
jgi:hypothetical protein